MIMRIAYDSRDPYIKVAKMIVTSYPKIVKNNSSQEKLKKSVDNTFHSIYSLDRGQ